MEDFFAATRMHRGLLDAPKLDKQVDLTKVKNLAAKYDRLIQRATDHRIALDSGSGLLLARRWTPRAANARS